MSLLEKDTFRVGLESLPESDLRSTVIQSLNGNDAAVDDLVWWLDEASWPLKIFEGTVSIARGSAGNPESKFTAQWQREIYVNNGPAFEGILGDWAKGPTALIAIWRLWLLCQENIKRESAGML